RRRHATPNLIARALAVLRVRRDERPRYLPPDSTPRPASTHIRFDCAERRKPSGRRQSTRQHAPSHVVRVCGSAEDILSRGSETWRARTARLVGRDARSVRLPSRMAPPSSGRDPIARGAADEVAPRTVEGEDENRNARREEPPRRLPPESVRTRSPGDRRAAWAAPRPSPATRPPPHGPSRVRGGDSERPRKSVRWSAVASVDAQSIGEWVNP